MTEQIGIVASIEHNGMARVLTDRQGACGGCHSGPGKCRGCLSTSGKLESHVANPINAGIGDVVKISISQGELFKGAALMYLLPILTLVAGAVGGLRWMNDAGSVLGGLIGLGIGFWAVARLGRSRRLSRRMTPRITEIVTRGNTPPRKPVNRLRSSCCA